MRFEEAYEGWRAERGRGLADLARPRDKYHLAREVGAQRGGEVV